MASNEIFTRLGRMSRTVIKRAPFPEEGELELGKSSGRVEYERKYDVEQGRKRGTPDTVTAAGGDLIPVRL